MRGVLDDGPSFGGVSLLEAGFRTACRGFPALSLPVTDDACDRVVAAFDRLPADRAGVFEGLR